MIMNPFIKAGLLTLAVVVLAFFFASEFDNARMSSLKKDIEQVVTDNQAQQSLYRYMQVMAKSPSEYCPYLEDLRENQFRKTNSIATKVRDYEKRNIFNSEYDALKSVYFAGLLDMYVSSFELRKNCNSTDVPLVLFYSIDVDCPSCVVQNEILDKVVGKCRNLRVYSFPIDGNVKLPGIISDRYSIASVPSMVFNDEEVVYGLQSEQSVIEKAKSHGAVCSE